MFRCQHHEGGAGQGVGTGGEHLDTDVGADRGELDRGTVARPDPVPLHLLDGVRPVDQVQVGDQAFGIGGDPHHPLAQRTAEDRIVADVAASVGGDLLVGEHRAEAGAPVDQLLGDEGQPVPIHDLPAFGRAERRPGAVVRVGTAPGCPGAGGEFGDQLVDRAGAVSLVVVPAVEDLQKDPLRPPVVLHVRGGDLAAGVVAEPQPSELAPHVVDVGLGGDPWVLPGVDGVLLGRQAEGVVTERMQDVVTGHPQVAGEHVGADVAEWMADMQTATGRVGEHVHDEERRTSGDLVETVRQRTPRVGGVERPPLRPRLLPAALDVAGQPGTVTERQVHHDRGRARGGLSARRPGAGVTPGTGVLGVLRAGAFGTAGVLGTAGHVSSSSGRPDPTRPADPAGIRGSRQRCRLQAHADGVDRCSQPIRSLETEAGRPEGIGRPEGTRPGR